MAYWEDHMLAVKNACLKHRETGEPHDVILEDKYKVYPRSAGKVKTSIDDKGRLVVHRSFSTDRWEESGYGEEIMNDIRKWLGVKRKKGDKR